MNLSSFHLKSLEQRAGLVSQEGIYLATRYWSDYSYHLFFVRQLFVEVWQENSSNNLLLIRGFTGTLGLIPYLDLIDISQLHPNGE